MNHSFQCLASSHSSVAFQFSEKNNLSTFHQFPSSSIQRRIPIRVILNEDEEVISSENISETADEISSYRPSSAAFQFIHAINGNDILKIAKESDISSMKSNAAIFESKIVYHFNILKSRQKEKKYLRKKFSNIMTRVHNMDCLLKKIKAKFLKFVYISLQRDLKEMNIEIKKFDQCQEVRNLNVPHNRDNFINLTIIDVLINNRLISPKQSELIFRSDQESLKVYLNKKIKSVYQFGFLQSRYFKTWLNDPIKIHIDTKLNLNKNCEKFPNHSKNIFRSSPENYERYKKLLLHTACNFLFYFQNNPQKFGKRQRDSDSI